MTNVIISERFKNSGSPQTGLSPTVNIYRISKTGVKTDLVTDGSMTEWSDGLYYYSFNDFDIRKDYIFTFDAGAASDSRYKETAWTGLDQWIAAMPRAGGGNGPNGMTAKDIKEMGESIKDSLGEFFDTLTLTPPDYTKLTEKAVNDIKKQADKDRKEIIKIVDKKLAEIDTKDVIVKPNVTVEKVDLAELHKFIKDAKSSPIPVDTNKLDFLMGGLVKQLDGKLKEAGELYGQQILEIAEQRAYERLLKEFSSNIKR